MLFLGKILHIKKTFSNTACQYLDIMMNIFYLNIYFSMSIFLREVCT